MCFYYNPINLLQNYLTMSLFVCAWKQQWHGIVSIYMTPVIRVVISTATGRGRIRIIMLLETIKTKLNFGNYKFDLTTLSYGN